MVVAVSFSFGSCPKCGGPPFLDALDGAEVRCRQCGLTLGCLEAAPKPVETRPYAKAEHLEIHDWKGGATKGGVRPIRPAPGRPQVKLPPIPRKPNTWLYSDAEALAMIRMYYVDEGHSPETIGKALGKHATAVRRLIVKMGWRRS